MIPIVCLYSQDGIFLGNGFIWDEDKIITHSANLEIKKDKEKIIRIETRHMSHPSLSSAILNLDDTLIYQNGKLLAIDYSKTKEKPKITTATNSEKYLPSKKRWNEGFDICDITYSYATSCSELGLMCMTGIVSLSSLLGSNGDPSIGVSHLPHMPSGNRGSPLFVSSNKDNNNEFINQRDYLLGIIDTNDSKEAKQMIRYIKASCLNTINEWPIIP